MAQNMRLSTQEENLKVSSEQLENLRKKLIHNNIDKNLEAFFNEKNIRVPGLLQNLR